MSAVVLFSVSLCVWEAKKLGETLSIGASQALLL